MTRCFRRIWPSSVLFGAAFPVIENGTAVGAQMVEQQRLDAIASALQVAGLEPTQLLNGQDAK